MTQPHKEALALAHLNRQGFAAYCPMVNKRVRHARKSMAVQRPLFPSYIFVANNPLRRWQAIRSTIGVRSLISRGDEPSLLDGRFVQELRARELDGLVARPASPFEVGQAVRISQGAFADIIGEIIELRDDQRVMMLLDLLGGKVKTMVRNDWIREL